MKCNMCGTELTSENTHELPSETKVFTGVTCKQCIEFNSNIRLFHGEDLLMMLKRMSYVYREAADHVKNISDVNVSNVFLIEESPGKGYLKFVVKAEVEYEQDNC